MIIDVLERGLYFGFERHIKLFATLEDLLVDIIIFLDPVQEFSIQDLIHGALFNASDRISVVPFIYHIFKTQGLPNVGNSNF